MSGYSVVFVHPGFFKGTMRREDADAKVLFLAMLYEAGGAGAAGDGVVSGSWDHWAYLCGWDKEEDGGERRVRAALERLMARDPGSTSKEEDGRRIVEHEPERYRNMYRIVNYGRYREIRKAENKRYRDRMRYQRKKMAERERRRAEGSTGRKVEQEKVNFMDRDPATMTPEERAIYDHRMCTMTMAEARELCDREGL